MEGVRFGAIVYYHALILLQRSVEYFCDLKGLVSSRKGGVIATGRMHASQCWYAALRLGFVALVDCAGIRRLENSHHFVESLW
jgi:hypothetical protein